MKLPIILLLAALLTGCAFPMAQTSSTAGNPAQRGASENAAATATVSQPTATESTPAPLTKEQAEAIALKHAGFTADQVSRLHTEYEVDDGVPRFEVRFRQDRWEYDYEIHAETGTILSCDRDD